MPKTNNMAELSAALRSWRRHFGRAREVGASLPDGTLLLRALEAAVQVVAKENSQAAFRLAQSRAALRVDELPQPQAIWDFSQCLLAEAETLVLLNSATSQTSDVPLKLKVIDAADNINGKKSGSDAGSSGKGRGTTTADVPCKWFRSDAGCRAGKACKWSHSWEGISDKATRCWNCGSKEHRKQDCMVKGGGQKKSDEPKGSGGGGGSGFNGNNTKTTFYFDFKSITFHTNDSDQAQDQRALNRYYFNDDCNTWGVEVRQPGDGQCGVGEGCSGRRWK